MQINHRNLIASGCLLACHSVLFQEICIHSTGTPGISAHRSNQNRICTYGQCFFYITAQCICITFFCPQIGQFLVIMCELDQQIIAKSDMCLNNGIMPLCSECLNCLPRMCMIRHRCLTIQICRQHLSPTTKRIFRSIWIQCRLIIYCRIPRNVYGWTIYLHHLDPAKGHGFPQ